MHHVYSSCEARGRGAQFVYHDRAPSRKHVVDVDHLEASHVSIRDS